MIKGRQSVLELMRIRAMKGVRMQPWDGMMSLGRGHLLHPPPQVMRPNARVNAPGVNVQPDQCLEHVIVLCGKVSRHYAAAGHCIALYRYH